MKQQLLLLAILSICCVEAKLYKMPINRKTKFEKRQWGGMETNTGDNFGGWLVRVRCSGPSSISCVGAYYSPLIVISSANCIHPFRYQSDGSDVVTTANADDEEFSFSLVETYYFPEDFRYLQTNADIAVARLMAPLRGKLTEFIKLTNWVPEEGTTLFTFGWGFNSLEVQAPTDDLRSAEVKVVELDDCKRMFKKGFIADTVMCAMPPEDNHMCIYDGGSPLIWQNELVAIASVGSSCLNTSVPSIYTYVLKMTAFITEIHDSIQ